jgi:hypothetical protein
MEGKRDFRVLTEGFSEKEFGKGVLGAGPSASVKGLRGKELVVFWQVG